MRLMPIRKRQPSPLRKVFEAVVNQVFPAMPPPPSIEEQLDELRARKEQARAAETSPSTSWHPRNARLPALPPDRVLREPPINRTGEYQIVPNRVIVDTHQAHISFVEYEGGVIQRFDINARVYRPTAQQSAREQIEAAYGSRLQSTM
jgi:hypothetical protein